MKKENNDDSQIEKHKNGVSQEKFDTLDFYKENLPLNAVEKLYLSSQKTKEMAFENNRLFGNEDAKEPIEENINTEVILKYIDFINKYNKKSDTDRDDADDEKNIFISDNHKKHTKKNKNITKTKKRKTRSQEEEDFLNNFTSRTGTFNYEYLKPRNPVIKIFTSISFIIFLAAIAFLCYKINLLNTKLINAQSRLEKNIDTKKELEAVLLENQNLKKTIDDLNNSQTSNSNVAQPQNISKPLNTKPLNNPNIKNNNQAQEKKSKEYIVQSGDTLSSISKKFYGNSNSYQKIMDQNKLLNDNLAENQKLIIPE
jgi:nucleoid-associated protein YgaU